MNRARNSPPKSSLLSRELLSAVALVLVGVFLVSSSLQTWLSSEELALNFISRPAWATLSGPKHEISFIAVSSVTWGTTFLFLFAGSFWIANRQKIRFVEAFARWGFFGWAWWCFVGLWEWIWIGTGLVGWSSLTTLMSVSPQFWLAFGASGFVTTFVCLSTASANPSASPSTHLQRFPSSRWLWSACALYTVVFVTMNWRLYFNLLIPHGDSAMYEEHLWNLLHGKGFRSYLDQGLFLGEHIQVVHLLLIPLYVFWPSHLLLELCESTALALGAVPVFWMTRRHTQSDRAGLAAAVAYLLYFPMQFLDIEIDLKTFRPEAFGIPLLLLTLDQLDRKNLLGFLAGLFVTLSVKEDYSLIFGPLGIWVAFLGGREERHAAPTGSLIIPGKVSSPGRVRWLITGISLSVFSVAYLWLATRVIMPWFRSGAEIHYVSYFKNLGKTPEEIIWNVFMKPEVWFNDLVSVQTALYAMAMLAPVAFLPLFSPGRLCVGVPLFCILCLNELAKDPRHHFHAPLVPIVFWSVATGLPQAIPVFKRLFLRWKMTSVDDTAATAVRSFLWTSSLFTGVFFSLSPVGIVFWDPGASLSWQKLYPTSKRALMFQSVPSLIPTTSRVASTDFVHPRFTHYDRSYDYSKYRRKVSNYERRVPDDTDYIVIDTQHPYNLRSDSPILTPSDVAEYRDHPDQWEVVPDQTQGFFIVLKRRTSAN